MARKKENSFLVVNGFSASPLTLLSSILFTEALLNDRAKPLAAVP